MKTKSLDSSLENQRKIFSIEILLSTSHQECSYVWCVWKLHWFEAKFLFNWFLWSSTVFTIFINFFMIFLSCRSYESCCGTVFIDIFIISIRNYESWLCICESVARSWSGFGICGEETCYDEGDQTKWCETQEEPVPPSCTENWAAENSNQEIVDDVTGEQESVDCASVLVTKSLKEKNYYLLQA